MNLHYPRFPGRKALALFFSLLLAGQTHAAQGSQSVPAERDLIKLLQSNASPEEKAITCKRLAIYGSKNAVPALAALLSDERLASWARIPLEAIPGSAPADALRNAMEKLQGNLLIGVINSLGVRRDQKAVGLLIPKLADSNPNVACAAAESLGRIGGSKAANALKSHLDAAPAEVQSAIAEGCIRCAEQFMAEGNYSQAVKFYDLIRNSTVPKERMLEATRGAILARRSDGLPLLIEQLRSSDKALLGIGLRTARELRGAEVTAALATEMHHSPPDRQPLLLLALAERGDPTASPVILEAACNGSKKLSLVAVGILDRAGDPAALPVLLEVASSDDRDLAQPAKSAVARLPGNGVDKEIIARLSKTDDKSRSVLFEIAGRRGMTTLLPIMLQFADSPNAATRNAALGAIGSIGGEPEASALVKLLETQSSSDRRADTEKALLAISSTKGVACAPIVLPLARNKNKDLRLIAVRTLAAIGGPAALNAVQAATEDDEEDVREEAAQTLSSWPNTWPEDDRGADALLAFAKSARKPSHKILAVRGFLQFLLGDEKLKPDEKLRRVNDVLPLLSRPEDKRLAIAVIRQIQKPDALELLINFTAEPAVAEDACSAIVEVAKQKKTKLSKEARQHALQIALEKSTKDSLKQKAQDALQKLD